MCRMIASPPSTGRLLPDFSLWRLLTVLLISLCYFVVALIISQDTNCLVLQADAYHMLYNSLYLGTSIFTTRMCRKGLGLRNTFGWIRIEVCGAVVSVCFLSALLFSVTADAMQIILKSVLTKEVPETPSTTNSLILPKSVSAPVWIGSAAIFGLFVNIFTLVTIGGYTFHQKEVLGSNKPILGDGDEVQKPVVQANSKVSRTLGAFRDVFGCFFAMGYGIIQYYFWNKNWISWVDPVVTILEVIVLGWLSYSYAKEAGLVLLLTIPSHIDVVTLANELYDNFPEIYDVHEFHIWQLTPRKIIASAHLVCQNSNKSWEIQKKVILFLQTKGISHVTLQPEFLSHTAIAPSTEAFAKGQCFIPCGSHKEDCQEKKCCLSESQSLFGLLSPNRYEQLHAARGKLLSRSQSLPNLSSKAKLTDTIQIKSDPEMTAQSNLGASTGSSTNVNNKDSKPIPKSARN